MSAPSTIETRQATLVLVTYLVPRERWFYRTLPASIGHTPDPVREAQDAPKNAFAFFYAADSDIVFEHGPNPPQYRFSNGCRTTNFFIPSGGELLTAEEIENRKDIPERRIFGILRYMQENSCDRVILYGPDGDKRAFKFYTGTDQEVASSY